ncbi:TM helix repeat-containing protein [Actinoplanes sp. N902-109]|uniref:mechanosensitive ion channel family protein n=1 Tax=Actinoplanes sp. (strain N902-109) TaxID=649831 RepID=UPI00032953CC|nr:TM helix repeat-containing protein [Actinoplanes sp. N902-109]AGL19633.1 TM helix repeat-containing protein [Actinoplanes sp. N902-109]
MTGPDVGDALRDMWRSILLFIPALLAFLLILVVGYVLARLLRTVTAKALHRVGFDRAVERGAVGRALGDRIQPSDLCAKIVFYAVMLFALQLAFGIWGPNPVSDLLTALVAWLPRAFVAVVIVVVAAAVGGAVRDLISSALGGLGYGRLLGRVAYGLIVALGVIAALDQVRIATSVTQPVLIAVLATVAGVVIVGVGGGLVRPMQRRWDMWLERASAETAVIREHARTYAEEKARREREAAEQARREEEARVEAARKAEEEARSKAEAERAEAARKAAEAQLEAERKAEQERAEAERKAAAEREEAVRQAARRAEEARARAEEERTRTEEERSRAEEERRRAEEERRRVLEQSAGEQTVAIPVQRRPRDDNPVPGFGPGDDDDDDPTELISDEETQIIKRPPADPPTK